MTLDKLATMAQAEFVAIRKDITKISEVMATKDDLREMEVKIVDEVSRRVIQSNDRVVTKLDTVLRDLAAHDSLHTRITDELHDHDKRIKRLEEAKTP